MAIPADGLGLEAIRRINNTVVNDDGTVKSFKEQLLEFEFGYYNATLPFILAPSSAALLQAGAKDYPITMAPGILKKLMDRHDVYPRDIAELPTLIRESNVLMMDSYTYRAGGLCMYLDESGSNEAPLFAAFHLDERAARVSVNEFMSVYERANIEHTIKKTWDEGLRLYPNEKTENWLQSFGLQLPDEIASLLNGSYRSVSKDELVPADGIVTSQAVDFKSRNPLDLFRHASEPDKFEAVKSSFAAAYGEDAAKGFAQRLDEVYNVLYDSYDPVAHAETLSYEKETDAFDQFNGLYPDFVAVVAAARGDFISSDREAAAFMYAYAELMGTAPIDGVDWEPRTLDESIAKIAASGGRSDIGKRYDGIRQYLDELRGDGFISPAEHAREMKTLETLEGVALRDEARSAKAASAELVSDATNVSKGTVERGWAS